MTAEQIIANLQANGSEQTRNLFLRHGVQEPVYGVKIEHLKRIAKTVGKDHILSLALYASGIADAQYLAGLIADEKKIKADELRRWAGEARGTMVGEYTVPWIAAESSHGYALALEWIGSGKEKLEATGWSTLANLVALLADKDLDLEKMRTLLGEVAAAIHRHPDRVGYTMNNFLINVGIYVAPLSKEALAIGEAAGKLSIDMNGTACKVPYAPDYIRKALTRGAMGKKKKTVRC